MADSNTSHKTTTGKLKANPTEQAKYHKMLHQALQKGIEAMPTQLKAVMMLSQANGGRSVNNPLQLPVKRTNEARLETLSVLASSLPPDKRRAIFQEIQNHPSVDIRLPLCLRLIPYLEADMLPPLFKSVWEDIQHMTDVALRAKAMLDFLSLIPNFNTDDALVSQTLLEAIGHARAMISAESRLRSLVILMNHMPNTLQANFFKTVLDELSGINNDVIHANTIVMTAHRVTPATETWVFHHANNIASAFERARALTALISYVSDDLKDVIRHETLSTIAQIQSEEDRANALTAFARHLGGMQVTAKGYPIYLEQALRIAVSLTRHNLRARAMVAIAPYLTLDLQGEALAIVNSLPQESERASLLAALAPTLPANMLIASLAVAHSMREQDARVHALTVLAHHMPAHARSQTVLDALAAATNLPNHFERVTALMALVDILPAHLLDQAYTNALETARLIENENTRARAISLIGQDMPQNLVPRALDIAYQIRDFQQRLNALVGIAPRLSRSRKPDVQKEMLVCLQHIPFEYKQARALVSIAPHLQDEYLEQALQIANHFSDPLDRVNGILALLPRLDDTTQKGYITQIRNLIHQIEDGYDRATAIAALFPFVSETDRELLAFESAAILRQIEDEYDRASAISILAPILEHGKRTTAYSGQYDNQAILSEALSLILGLPNQNQRAELLAASCGVWVEQEPQTRYRLWANFAPKLAELPLADVLLCISALMPLFHSFGGDKLLREFASLLEVR